MSPKLPATTEKEISEITAEDAKVLAESIRKLAKGVADLGRGGLNRKAIVVLLNESTGVTRRDINAVIDGLEGLGREYLEMAKEK